MGRAYTFARIAGIELRVDLSWLVIAALIVWSFWSRFSDVTGVGTGVAVAMAVVGALLFFGSVLGHELAHALEAKHRGVTIAGITLFLFGGVTETKFDVKRPRDELALTAIGPFTSVVLAAGLGLLARYAGAAGIDSVAFVAGYLAWINLALGVFNLLPGAPLDGGRILRSIAWWITGNRLRAIRIAAGAGWAVSAAIIGFGFLQLFAPGGFVGGIWLLFIGWFLMQGASAEWTQAKIREALDDVPVSRLVDTSISEIPASVSVREAVERWIRTRDPDLFPVVDSADGWSEREIVGVIGVDEVRDVDRARWDITTAGEAMTPVGDLPTVDAEKMADDVVDDLIGSGRVVVATEDGDVTGLITAQRLALVARRSARLRSRRTS